MIGINVESNIEDVLTLTSKVYKVKQSAISDITEIVRSDIEKNLELGRSWNGTTIKSKIGGGRIFYQTGELLKSVLKRVTTDYGEVFINSNRNQIAEWLNKGTSKMVSRPFFGISNRTSTEIDKYLNSKSFEQLFK